MTLDEFRNRTRAFALRVIRLVEALPKSVTGRVIAGQLLRCATSVGANYRAACRAKSRADFIATMRIVEEECDESLYWMELLVESGRLPAARLDDLMKEGHALVALVVASVKTARAGQQSITPKSAYQNLGGQASGLSFDRPEVGPPSGFVRRSKRRPSLIPNPQLPIPNR